ncbi:deoxyribonuclease V [Amycolatopsis xylanica]|uniref:Endonuclease V n=1 Tax=Amycolatopsis xylanica TaxID=589385 RepID=A0A1H2RTW2_9PSEU|nr:endonuclease V [Amycolatopsis xylanica]SDW22922.1 deoxyribonuclease V [Amycolatopsis xylanica]
MQWPETEAEAIALQLELAPRVDCHEPEGFSPRAVAGLDVDYRDDHVAAAVVVLDADSLIEIESATAITPVRFPYIPGLFSFRELPPLLAAIAKLTVTPDLLIADGHGLAHPRRFGLACHLGVVTGIPTIGVAKTPMGGYDAPADTRGATTPLVDKGETVGAALRTQRGVKPVFVSVGHRISLERACAEVLRLAPKYRQPETTRRADRLCRDARATER